jgi:hypothetical protein
MGGELGMLPVCTLAYAQLAGARASQAAVDDGSSQITDLEAPNRGQGAQRYGQERIRLHQANNRCEHDRGQGGWDQDQHLEALPKYQPGQQAEDQKGKHLGLPPMPAWAATR